MVFYGSNSSTITKGQIRNVKCPNCDKDVSMSYTVFGKYAHLYWIPLFPIGKVKVVECNDCKATYDVKNLDESIKNKLKLEQDRNPVKTPITHFSGLGLIAVGIAVAFYFSKKNDDDTSMFAKNPKVGDVYYYEIPEMAGHFTTMKITKITKDSILVLSNNMEIDSKSSIDKILKDEYYTYPDGYSKSELKNLTKDLEIVYKITRKE